MMKSSAQGQELAQSLDRIGGPAPYLPQPFVLTVSGIETEGRGPMAL